jgi:hypothetical protein
MKRQIYCCKLLLYCSEATFFFIAITQVPEYASNCLKDMPTNCFVGSGKESKSEYSCLKFRLAMHEWALAEAILMSANKIAEKEKLMEVTEVTIGMGELQQVERSILRLALSEMKTPIFKNTKFRILKTKNNAKVQILQNHLAGQH